ncbi:UbiA family prenyltransferase [Bdellovibrio bacteriovorus]|uniref:UbiA family prenyltransferase n=1 Tax=Bdellovibrio bacteriovorus TaxID=959 RepID=UPI0035A94624
MSDYLVCDLDNCLIKTDALYEQWLSLLKRKPLFFLLSFLWLFKGKAYFKHQLANHTAFHPQLIPYREDVLQIIKAYRTDQKGQVILASASPQVWVEAVANHIGLFDQSIGSTEHKNLKGSQKLLALREVIGSKTFTYIGDHIADLNLWQHSSEIVAVNPSRILTTKIQALQKPTQIIQDKKTPWKLLLKQIRPHQWVKNALVFLPALAGHKLLVPEVFFKSLLAFAGFSLSASFVYVLNDLLDLPSDRNHHTKKKRPFASGNLPIKWGVFLLPLLLLGTSIFAFLLPLPFAGWIATYLILNIAYSFYFKQSVIVDIIILSMMYTLRIFAGSAAASVPVSEWLLSFSTLFFFSLACVKRYTEIIRSKNKITIDGRGYRQIDYPMVQSLGVGSGLISILIILLYLQGGEVRALYKNPQSLWYATPILLFWVSRIWLLTNRDEIHDDPVVFAVKDKVSWICLLILGIVFGLSI